MLWILRKLHIVHTWSKWEDRITKYTVYSRDGSCAEHSAIRQRRRCAVCNLLQEAVV